MNENAGFFTFCKKAPIWIYGCGQLGKTLGAKLIDSGFSVAGFIDRDKNRLANDEAYEVINPERVASLDEDAIIVLSFQNVLEHERVSKMLFAHGLDKIIYLYRDTPHYPKTFELYNELLYGDEVREFQFPLTLQNGGARGRYSNRVGDYVITDVPVQLIYSDKLPAEGAGPFEMTHHYNVCSMPDYNALFNYYLRGEYEPRYLNRYLECLRGGRSKEEFLADRLELCARYMQEFAGMGIESFRAAPAFAVFDKSFGRFIIKDGHHRSCFLANLGLDEIPLRMAVDDFNCWMNEAALSEMTGDDLSFPTIDERLKDVVLNPLVSGGDSLNRRCLQFMASSLTGFFGKVDLKGMSVLCIQSRLSFISRVFFRAGAQSVREYQPCREKCELSKQINRLEHAGAIDVIAYLPEESYDIVVWINEIVLDFEKYGEKLTQLCGRYFVVQIAENDIDMITTIEQAIDCREVKRLHSSIAYGITEEIIVFEKNV